MKKTFLLLLALTMSCAYGCTTTQTFDTVKYHTEDKGITIGRILHLPVTAYRSVMRGFEAEGELDADDDTLID
jgi:hypothetical protein